MTEMLYVLFGHFEVQSFGHQCQNNDHGPYQYVTIIMEACWTLFIFSDVGEFQNIKWFLEFSTIAQEYIYIFFYLSFSWPNDWFRNNETHLQRNKISNF